jgi:hypothetical protein
MPTKPSTPKRQREEKFRPLQGLASFADWLGEYDLEHYFDLASWAEPNIFETTEIFSAVAAECHAIAYKIYPRYMWRYIEQERRTNEFAPRIEDDFLARHPQLRGRVRIVYKRCGGIFDPRGRFTPIFKGAKRRGRTLHSVLKQTLYKDGIEVARKSTTNLNAIALDHFEIKKQRAKIPDWVGRVLIRLRIIRYSNWQGLKNAHKQNPRLWNGRVIDTEGVPTLCVVHSARKADVTHNKSVRRALRKINPDVVEFADVDRLGREYWEAARNSFEAMGMRVEFKDEGWRPDMHLRPATTKIDRQNQALKDDVCVVQIQNNNEK